MEFKIDEYKNPALGITVFIVKRKFLFWWNECDRFTTHAIFHNREEAENYLKGRQAGRKWIK